MRKLRTALQVVVTSQGNPETMKRVTENLVKERSDTAVQTADREQQLAMAVYEAEGRVNELKRERDNWQQQHSKAQAQATKSKGEVSVLRHQLTAAQATQAQAARELRQQTLMVEELTELAADATMYAMDLTENGMPSAALPTSQDADELEAATRVLSARAKEAGSAAGSLMMLEAQLRAKTLEAQESKRSLAVAERELSNVSTQLEAAQARITTLQEELRQLKAQVSDLQAELATRPTEQQLADLEAELTAPLELAERSLAEVVDATSKRESMLAGEMRQLERSLDAEKAARLRAVKELEVQLQVRPSSSFFSALPVGAGKGRLAFRQTQSQRPRQWFLSKRMTDAGRACAMGVRDPQEARDAKSAAAFASTTEAALQVRVNQLEGELTTAMTAVTQVTPGSLSYWLRAHVIMHHASEC